MKNFEFLTSLFSNCYFSGKKDKFCKLYNMEPDLLHL